MDTKKIFFTGVVLSLMISCSNQKNRILQFDVIDIESGLQNLTRLKTSDLGKTIRYIPLETTDEGLVGRDPVIKVLRNYIVVEAQRSCLLFDKKDGRFVAEIGHFGQDPTAFTNIFSWADDKEEFLYFLKTPNQLVKYDMKGNFCDYVKFSTQGLASYYVLTNTEIIGYFASGLGETKPYNIGFFDKSGILNDSIQLLSREQILPANVANIGLLKGKTSISVWGMWAQAGGMIVNFKDDTRLIIAPNAARLWKNNGQIRFKEEFIDTVYTISDHKLIPSIVFHTGKYHWPIHEITSKRNSNERVFIADVSENNTFVFFQCTKGMHSEEPVLYNGLHNKNTEEPHYIGF